jgi:serine protease
MKQRSILVILAFSVMSAVLAGTSQAEEFTNTGPRPLTINLNDESGIVREITVRYVSGVQRFDEDGLPRGTAHIKGVTFSFGHQYPNNIFGMQISPAVSAQNASLISDALMSSGLFEFADVMMPLQQNAGPGDQWHTCPAGVPLTDACLDKQSWYLDAVAATTAWDDSSANTAHAVVAVVDSGKLDHPDLVGSLLPGYDFINRSYVTDPFGTVFYRDDDGYESGGDDRIGYDVDPTDQGQGRIEGQCTTSVGYGIDDDEKLVPIYHPAPARVSNWHGTAVASIIAATRNNNAGIAGVAPAVKIVPVRVLGRCIESDDPFNLVNGMIWASGGSVTGVPANTNPAHVVNLSLGSYYEEADSCPTVYREVIAAGIQRGSVFVASAGNDATKSIENHVPSNCPGVISVGAVGPPTGSTFSKASYSTASADVVAPGGDILTEYSQGILVASNTETGSLTTPVYQYKFGQGTSFAAPIVSALIAMAKTKYRTSADNARLTPAAMKEAVKFAATFGPQCIGCGNGLLTSTNLFNVLNSSTSPTVALSLNASGGPNTTSQGRVSWSAPLSNTWNPITSYLVKAYSAASGGSVIDTCTPSSLSQLSCFFDDLAENTTYYVSVTATATSSTESARTPFTTFRRAAAPTGVTVLADSGKAIISWNEVTDFGNFSGFGLYEVIAYTSQFGDSVVGSCYGNDSCEITGLKGGTEYWIAVSVVTGQHPGGSFESSRFAVTPKVVANIPSETPANNPAGNITAPAPATSANLPPASPTNSPASSTQPTLTSKVGRTVTSSTALKKVGIKVPKRAKVIVKASSNSRKVCQVVRGSVKMIRKGRCTVTITMTPVKGKSIRKNLVIVA